jgi:hypothetical protein
VIGPQVHLLATPTIDARNLYFYTARVPAEFLDRFDMPSRFFPSSPFVISYYRIPLAPISRLTKELESVLCVRSRRRAEPGSGDGIAAEVALTCSRHGQVESRDVEVTDGCEGNERA